MRTKRTLIFGGSGQDGTILSKLALNKGHDLTIVCRKQQKFNINPNIKYYFLDVRNISQIQTCLEKTQPDLIFYCAGQTHSRGDIANADILDSYSTIQHPLLEIAKWMNLNSNPTRLINFGSIEMYGFQNEAIDINSTHSPNNFYGLAKSVAFNDLKFLRNSYGLNMTTVVLGNHESIMRGGDRLIGRILSHIKNNTNSSPLILSSPESTRDWGYAYEYMNFIFEKPDDFSDVMLVSGFSWSVRELVEAFIDLVGKDKLKVIWNEDNGQVFNENICNRYLITKKQKEYSWFPKYYGKNLVEKLIKDLNESS